MKNREASHEIQFLQFLLINLLFLIGCSCFFTEFIILFNLELLGEGFQNGDKTNYFEKCPIFFLKFRCDSTI